MISKDEGDAFRLRLSGLIWYNQIALLRFQKIKARSSNSPGFLYSMQT